MYYGNWGRLAAALSCNRQTFPPNRFSNGRWQPFLLPPFSLLPAQAHSANLHRPKPRGTLDMSHLIVVGGYNVKNRFWNFRFSSFTKPPDALGAPRLVHSKWVQYCPAHRGTPEVGLGWAPASLRQGLVDSRTAVVDKLFFSFFLKGERQSSDPVWRLTIKRLNDGGFSRTNV